MEIFLSFIVIGRNEGKYLYRCFKSIINTIETNEIKLYEIIYVDSNSTDDSIKIAKGFEVIRIYELHNIYNAAIARNVGANKSKGEVLFFIDGDMEIIPEFLKKVIINDNLIYPFISGNVIDNRYNSKGEYLLSTNHNLSISYKDKYSLLSGGIFIVDRNIWFKVKGMDNNLRRSEDFDFSIKMAKCGFIQKRLKENIAYHNTVDYRDSSRIWKMLFSGDYAYLYGPIFRRYISYPKFWKVLFKKSWSTIMLIILILLTILYSNISFLYVYIVCIVVDIIRVQVKQNNVSMLNLSLKIIHRAISDILSICWFIFFYPIINKCNIEIEEIK